MRCVFALVNRARGFVERGRRGYGVGRSVPGSVEFYIGVTNAGGDATVTTLVERRHVTVLNVIFIELSQQWEHTLPSSRLAIFFASVPRSIPVVHR
jgi:hypothetical protein